LLIEDKSVADYIDKNILCQAYVHVDLPEDITKGELKIIKDHLTRFATERAKFFVYPEVEVEVEFREGSLKTYITIAGAIYLAIGNYGDFRSGVEYLHTDIKRLADTMVAESLFSTKARHANIRRTEARVGVVGSLKVLVDDMNTLEASMGQISVEEVTRRIHRIREDAEALLTNVRAEEDIVQIEEELAAFSTSLPSTPKHPADKRPDDAAVLAYYDALAQLRKSIAKRKGSK
jgi:hypothetical protein